MIVTMKHYVTLLLLLIPIKLHANSFFVEMCQTFSKENNSNDVYYLQTLWLQKRFQTFDCQKIEEEIGKLESFSQFIPSYHFESKLGQTKRWNPFSPKEFANIDLQYLATKEEWDRYRFIFKNLRLFHQFKNLTHINHDLIYKDDPEDFCYVLENLPHVERVTIRYSDTTQNMYTLSDEEALCIRKRKLKVFVLGSFTPDRTSELLKEHITGIENFLGDTSELSQYSNLQYLGLLDFSSSQSLKALINVKKLDYLQVNVNYIKDTKDLSHLKYLKHLTLNCFERLSSNLTRCANNSLRNLDFLKSLRSLKGLDLSWNEIENFSKISRLKNLEYLILRMNKFSTLKDIEGLKKLVYLDIAGNAIQNLSSLEALRNLKFLNISDNQIISFAPLSNLPNLKYLSAGNNNYSTLKDFNPSKTLNVLNLDESKSSWGITGLNYVFQVPHESINEKGWTQLALFETDPGIDLQYDRSNSSSKYNIFSEFDMNKLKNIEYLSLNGVGIKNIPDLSPLKKIKYLNAASNHLNDVSFISNDNVAIQYLDLRNNFLIDITNLTILSNLKYLDLSLNPLENKTVEINSEKLSVLLITGCNLKTPPLLEQSLNIERLSLGGNQLTKFSTSSLKKLKYLDLSRNRLTEIPHLGESTSLYALDLSNNQINDFTNLIEFYRKYFTVSSSKNQHIWINLRGNEISDFSFFKNKDHEFLELIID